MRIKRMTLLLALSFILLGCTVPNAPGLETQVQGTPTSILDAATDTPLPAIPPSQTVVPTHPPTPTTTTIPVTTSAPMPTLQPSCFPVLDELPGDKAYSGRVLLFGEISIENIQNYFYPVSHYDLPTHQVKEMGLEKVKNLEVSPDRTNFAVKDPSDDRIKIYSQDGQLLSVLPEGEFPYSIDRWLNNEEIALVILRPMEGTSYYWYPFEQVVYNTITGESKHLSSDYPDIDKTQSRPPWEGISTTKYDPTLTRVVYPSLIENDYSGKSGIGYVLWDVENQQKILEIVTGDFAATPKWAPDGSKFVINDNYGDGKFYVITREGRIAHVFDLSTNLADENEGSRYFSDGYSWSPNGLSIAFWREMFKDSSIEATLAVLDTTMGEITDTCISAGFIEPAFRGHFGSFLPVWSPDGHALVIQANRQDSSYFETFLIDLREKFAVKLGESVFPVGWLANPGD